MYVSPTNESYGWLSSYQTYVFVCLHQAFQQEQCMSYIQSMLHTWHADHSHKGRREQELCYQLIVSSASLNCLGTNVIDCDLLRYNTNLPLRKKNIWGRW